MGDVNLRDVPHSKLAGGDVKWITTTGFKRKGSYRCALEVVQLWASNSSGAAATVLVLFTCSIVNQG